MKIGINRKLFVIVVFFVAFLKLISKVEYDIELYNEIFNKKILASGFNFNYPLLSYPVSAFKRHDISEKMILSIKKQNPLIFYMYSQEQKIENDKEYFQKEMPNKENNIIEVSTSLKQAVLIENKVDNSKKFIPVVKPIAEYSQKQLMEKEFIKENFFIEDPTTQLQNKQIDYEILSSFDATLKQDKSKPQILIYHTHSQETYIDSNILDEDTTIVGIGKKLAEILTEEYGFNVIHHTEKYDVISRDYAYSNAMEGLEKILEDNPSIEVIIDLHRDEVNEDTKLVTTIQDIPMAKFMFFNGLSYTKELGKLESLPNQYIQDNLAFSFQMKMAAEQYYPGLTRKIYLKGYRYNLHYRAKSLLIELGAQTNTVEEAKNSCQPLAHIIAMVLTGKKG